MTIETKLLRDIDRYDEEMAQLYVEHKAKEAELRQRGDQKELATLGMWYVEQENAIKNRLIKGILSHFA